MITYRWNTLLAAVVAAIVASACTQNVSLRPRADGGDNVGMIEFHALPPHHMKVVIDGRAYEGDVREGKIDETARIAARYGRGSRQVQAYFMGNTVAAHRGNAVLRSEQGDTIRCDYVHRGTRGEGICESTQGVTFDLVFQQ